MITSKPIRKITHSPYKIFKTIFVCFQGNTLSSQNFRFEINGPGLLFVNPYGDKDSLFGTVFARYVTLNVPSLLVILSSESRTP